MYNQVRADVPCEFGVVIDTFQRLQVSIASCNATMRLKEKKKRGGRWGVVDDGSTTGEFYRSMGEELESLAEQYSVE